MIYLRLSAKLFSVFSLWMSPQRVLCQQYVIFLSENKSVSFSNDHMWEKNQKFKWGFSWKILLIFLAHLKESFVMAYWWEIPAKSTDFMGSTRHHCRTDDGVWLYTMASKKNNPRIYRVQQLGVICLSFPFYYFPPFGRDIVVQ
jgi:hypothetical protein